MQPLIGELDHEEFWILLLNNANKMQYKWKLSVGGITAALVDVRLIYKRAIERGATSMILCHNHPSGNLMPSQSDIMLTKKVIKGGAILDIKVLDHIIVAEQGYYSFADEGNL
jgi:DNA repair protein RadC